MENLSNIFGFLIFAVIIITVFGTDVTPKNVVEERLLTFFDKWRSGDKTSLPFLLPSLEAITIPPLNGSYSGKGVKITYCTDKMKLVGMNNFSVDELDVSLEDMRASGALSVPLLGISSDDYKVEGRAFYVYSLKGSGKLDASFKNITLKFGIRLINNETHTNVDDFSLNFTIGGFQVDLENSSWPMNKVLNKEGVKIIEKYHEDIINATQKNLFRRLDNYLTTMTTTELIDKMQTSIDRVDVNDSFF